MNEKNIRLVTAESVRAGHPDKFCDQVADAILDAHLRQDPNAHVAVEVFATAGKIVVGGEITSKAKISYDKIVAGVINRIGYTMSDLCGDPHELLELEVCLHEQSPDISAAVDKTELGAGETLGAGDQGIVVGYATNETEEYLPLPVVLAHRICKRLDELKPENPWMGADGKAQVTVAYENDVPVAVTAVVVSLQHDAEIDHKSIRRFIGKEVLGKVLPRELLKEDTSILINPSGKFVLGGPAADAGLMSCTSVSSHSPFRVSVTVQDMGVTAPIPLLEKSVQSAGYTQIRGNHLLQGIKKASSLKGRRL